LIAKTDKGITALEKFNIDCQAFLVKRLLRVTIVNYDPFTIEVSPNLFRAGTLKDKNPSTMLKTKKIIQEQWMNKYNIKDEIDYEVE
jgi:hypothetical protein